MTVPPPTISSSPSCGSSATLPWSTTGSPALTYQKPPAGYAAWKVTVTPDPSLPVDVNSPIQMRLLQAPVQTLIQGQKMTWDGQWVNFDGVAVANMDVPGIGDVLFIPVAPSRTYTMQARAATTSGLLLVFSTIVSCSLNVVTDITQYGMDVSTIRYRIGG